MTDPTQQLNDEIHSGQRDSMMKTIQWLTKDRDAALDQMDRMVEFAEHRRNAQNAALEALRDLMPHVLDSWEPRRASEAFRAAVRRAQEVLASEQERVMGRMAATDAQKSGENPPREDICGLCGRSGANKHAHPVRWPGERVPNHPYVHDFCEQEECQRAHSALTVEQRAAFLRTL